METWKRTDYRNLLSLSGYTRDYTQKGLGLGSKGESSVELLFSHLRICDPPLDETKGGKQKQHI